jgi:hypothetical protein
VEEEEEDYSIHLYLFASILLIPIVLSVSRHSKIAVMELIVVNCLIRKKIQMKMTENLKKN